VKKTLTEILQGADPFRSRKRPNLRGSFISRTRARRALRELKTACDAHAGFRLHVERWRSVSPENFSNASFKPLLERAGRRHVTFTACAIRELRCSSKPGRPPGDRRQPGSRRQRMIFERYGIFDHTAAASPTPPTGSSTPQAERRTTTSGRRESSRADAEDGGRARTYTVEKADFQPKRAGSEAFSDGSSP